MVALVALPINYRDAGAERLTRKRVDYYNFGTLYQRRGDWAAAEDMFHRVLDIDPSFAPARNGLATVTSERGLALFAQGKYRAAIAAFTKVLEIYPPYEESKAVLGSAELAEAPFRLGSEARGGGDSKLPRLHNNLGLCYYRLGDLATAARHFEQALVLDPQYVRAHFNLGLMYAKQGDDQAAADAFAQALELEPNYVQAHYRRGEVLLRLGRPREAEFHWTFLRERNPDDVRLQAKIDSMTQANP